MMGGGRISLRLATSLLTLAATTLPVAHNTSLFYRSACCEPISWTSRGPPPSGAGAGNTQRSIVCPAGMDGVEQGQEANVAQG